MTVYVTAVTPDSCRRHEDIMGIRWLDSSTSTSNTMSKPQAVDWVRKGNRLYVAGETGAVEVRVVDADPPYLRTVANNTYTDNLLSLPRY
jgi:hypothetical protein